MRVAVEASPNLAAEHDESLRPFSLEFRVRRGFASLCCPKGSAVDVGRARLRLPRAGERRHQRGIAAQRRAVGCGSVDDHIEATPIIPIRLAWQGQDLRVSAVLPLAALVDQSPQTTPPWNSQEHVFNPVRQGKLGRDFSRSQNSEFYRVLESFSSDEFLHQPAAELLTTPLSYSRDSLLKVSRQVQAVSSTLNSDIAGFSLFSDNVLPRTVARTSALDAHSRPKFSKARTGNRIKHRQDKGCYSFYKRPHLSKGRGPIREFIQPQSRTPPPSGTPGAPSGVNEECSPTLVGALAGKRGAQRRARRRREYRLWRRFSNKVRGKRVDPSPLAPARSSQAARSNARWFRNAILWQQQLRRRKRRKVVNSPTTPPLQYQSSVKVGTLNVQGFAETLKLKSALLLMQTHSIDVLMLTETRSNTYYSYQSEGYLIILSGNKQDRYAGVGAIVAPRLRPHLLDVIQVSSRIIHLAFKLQGGNLHTVGTYAPHSGLDLETVREPFWEQLQDHVSNIPQPEPVVVTGDFNVRFQAKHRNDGHCLGPFVYGKGPSFIDHSASSNRSLCRSFLQHQNLVEAASYKTPDLLKHITYRDKTAPPSDWSQFVLDPIPLQQFYTKLEARLGELALDVSSKVRSYLTNESLLPPPTIPPQVDPIRFQRLDHCFFFSTKLFEQLPRSQCKLRTKGAYGVLAKRQPARGARDREVQHVTQRERVWRTRQRRHGPDSERGAGDGSLQGNRQHTPPAARPALGCSGAQGWWGALDTKPE